MQYPFCIEMTRLQVVHTGQPHEERFPQPNNGKVCKHHSNNHYTQQRITNVQRHIQLLPHLVLHVKLGSMRTQVFCYMEVAMARGPIERSISMLFKCKDKTLISAIISKQK